MGSTKLFVGALGMGLAFAPTALYAYYVHHARVWGLSAHDDQSIAGIVMAVEQSLVMGIALVVLFVRALARVRARAATARALRSRLSRAEPPDAPLAPLTDRVSACYADNCHMPHFPRKGSLQRALSC